MFLTSLHDAVALCLFFNMTVGYANAFHASSWDRLKRSVGDEAETQEMETRRIECKEQQLETLPGTVSFFSEGESNFCSLYIGAPIDHVVEMEFLYFDVDCADEGAVAILDGWELDFEIFPSEEDHPHPMSLRYLSFCGKSIPDALYTSKQNVAQVQFIVPREGQGFQVKINFNANYKPCNMLLLTNDYHKITLRNFGLTKNCSVVSLYAQRVQLLYVNVGERSKQSLLYQSLQESQGGLRTSCHRGQAEDSVQLYQGTGVGLSSMKLVLGFCGVRQTVAHRLIKLRCLSSALRLESSGEYFNVVRFAFMPAEQEDGTEC
ncbi:hypothetical protein BsWGS_17129 [Bradybaena similaris]